MPSLGYNQGVPAGILGNEDFLRVVDYPGSAVLGLIVGIYNIGCLTGTAIAFLTSDPLGFRKSMWIAMGILTASLHSLGWKISNRGADWGFPTSFCLFQGTNTSIPIYQWNWYWNSEFYSTSVPI